MDTNILNSRIYVAGHHGMVGSAIVRRLKELGAQHVLTRDRKDLDLTDKAAVQQFFADQRPDYVFLAAAKVGGILANETYPAEFIHDNLAIELNVIDSAYQHSVKRLVFLGSSCIYPKNARQPMTESELLNGRLEPSNDAYAIAKIAGIKMCESYNRQYKTDFRSLMPTNLYGPGDNFHPQNSHVLPALLRRFVEAKETQAEHIVLWGSGTPKREFLHVEDMANAAVYFMGLDADQYWSVAEPRCSHINIGTGEDLSISELAAMIAKITGYQGEIVYDRDKPDGTPRKLLDVSRANQLGWKAQVSLQTGINMTYSWYLDVLNKQVQLREK
ncbi:MAG: GDP-L-fucose synthase family protein [bacterium]